MAHDAADASMEVVNLSEKFGRFTDHRSPKIVGEVNDMHVKLAKLSGDVTNERTVAAPERLPPGLRSAKRRSPS